MKSINVLLWRWPGDRDCDARAVFVLGLDAERVAEGRVFAPHQAAEVRAYVRDLQKRWGVDPVFIKVEAEKHGDALQLWAVEQGVDPADDERFKPGWGG